MGIIRAAAHAVGGGLADQWLEVIEPENMGEQTVFSAGVQTRRGENRKRTPETVSNGSVIHVYPNQFMMLVDGGKVVDYTAEEGYYTVQNSSLPSLFNGQFGDALKESFNRVRYGGQTPYAQKVYYINLQEIKGIKFGTWTPINYFDLFYNSELFLRAHGTYSIKITDPLKFYAEAIPKNQDQVEIDSINEQYLAEFLEALQTSINQMSADGVRISFVASKGRELGRYMAETLDEEWNRLRGMEIQSVGIASISYDEESQKLINMRNQGAMLGDPSVREGYVQGAMARGFEAAGSNGSGAMAGFMGMGAGMNFGGGFMGAASASNLQQMQMQQAARQGYAAPQGGYAPGQANRAPQGGYAQQPGQMDAAPQGGYAQPAGQNAPPQGSAAAPAESWTCECGNVNHGKFCSECGKPRPAGPWTCSCGTVNTGKFCSECGKPRS